MAKKRTSSKVIKNESKGIVMIAVLVLIVAALVAVSVKLSQKDIAGEAFSYKGGEVDLSNYPYPFIEGGQANLLIVVGDSAPAGEVAAVTAIASGLSSGEIVTMYPTEEAPVKIESSGNKLNIDEFLKDVKNSIASQDMPHFLADGVLKNSLGSFDYEQKISFGSGAKFMHLADSDFNNKEPTLMVYGAKNMLFLQYGVTFTSGAKSRITTEPDYERLPDFENSNPMKLMRREYDIVNTELSGNSLKLELLRGAIKDTLKQGQYKIYSGGGDDVLNVEAVYIGPSEVKFKVNGELTPALAKGQIYKIAYGIDIGVKNIIYETGDTAFNQVEFYLGAEKLTIEDEDYLDAGRGGEISVNDEPISDLIGEIAATRSGDELTISRIELLWAPIHEIFIANDIQGSSAQIATAYFPGLGSFEISLDGFTVPAEEVSEIRNNGDKIIELRTTLKSGEVTIPLLGSDGTKFVRIGGDDLGEGLRTVNSPGGTMTFDKDTDDYFVATYWDGWSNGESYLLEVTDVDDADGVDFKDVANGVTYQNKRNTTAGTGPTFSIGSVTLTVNWAEESNNSVSITAATTNIYFDRVITKEGLMIGLPVEALNNQFYVDFSTNPVKYKIQVIEESADGKIGNGKLFVVEVGHNAQNQVHVEGINAVLSGELYEIGDTSEFVGYVSSALATQIDYHTEFEQDTVKLVYHGGESYANVYLRGFGVPTYSLNSIDAPVTVLASEVADISAQNVITVGSPCNNPVSDYFLDCDDWKLNAGQAEIRLYQNGDYVALLVAGTNPEDTLTAGKVLQGYKDFALSGDVNCVTRVGDSYQVQSVACTTETPEEEVCTDSDGGKNYYVVGTTTGLNVFNERITATDYCQYAGQYGYGLQPGQEAVMEYVCSSDGKTINDDLHICPNGCYEGACKPDFVTNGANTIALKAKLATGDVSIDFLSGDGNAFTMIGGDDADERLVVVEEMNPTFTFDKDTDDYFVITDEINKKSYLIEIPDIDDYDGVDFKDAAAGVKYENKKAGATFTIGSIELKVYSFSEMDNTVSLSVQGRMDRIYTTDGRMILLPTEGNLPAEHYKVMINEADGATTQYIFGWENGAAVVTVGTDVPVPPSGQPPKIVEYSMPQEVLTDQQFEIKVKAVDDVMVTKLGYEVYTQGEDYPRRESGGSDCYSAECEATFLWELYEKGDYKVVLYAEDNEGAKTSVSTIIVAIPATYSDVLIEENIDGFEWVNSRKSSWYEYEEVTDYVAEYQGKNYGNVLVRKFGTRDGLEELTNYDLMYWWLSKFEKINGNNVYHTLQFGSEEAYVWLSGNQIIAMEGTNLLAIAEAYLNKYPSDMEAPVCGSGKCEFGEELSCADCSDYKTICSNLEYVKDKCYRAYGKRLAEEEACALIETSYMRDDCYQNVAIEKKDPTLCSQIETPWSKDYCYQNIALDTLNAELCGNIQEQWVKDECYLSIAKMKQDKSICSNIINTDVKKWCETASVSCGNNKCEWWENTFCTTDCPPPKEYMIEEDIGEYKFKGSSISDENIGGEGILFYATYVKDDEIHSAYVAKMDSYDALQRLLEEMNENPAEKTAINLAGQVAYVIEGEAVYWTSSNLLVMIAYNDEMPTELVEAYLNKYNSDAGQIRKEYGLKKGWNLISIPVIPENMDLKSVFGPIINDVSSIYTYKEGQWFVFHADSNIPSNLEQLEVGRGYWVKMKDDAMLSLKGTLVVVVKDQPIVPPKISLSEGWNLIGVHAMSDVSSSEYFAGVEKKYVSLWAYELGQAKKLDIKQDPIMNPGRGYWVYMKEAGVIAP